MQRELHSGSIYQHYCTWTNLSQQVANNKIMQRNSTFKKGKKLNKRKGFWITWAKVLWNFKANKSSNRGTKMLSRNIVIALRWLNERKRNHWMESTWEVVGRGEKKEREKCISSHYNSYCAISLFNTMVMLFSLIIQ